MASEWFKFLQSAQKMCLIQGNRRKIHYTFNDGQEMCEEYDLKNDLLLVRKWKKKGKLGGEGSWDFEVGEDLQGPQKAVLTEGLTESSSNPIFLRKDSAKSFQWRIRNLPYPIETYEVKVNTDDRTIIIRTSNKKYYKKFSVPDLDRCKLDLDQTSIETAHANNTLIVSYKKPSEILTLESMLQKEFRKMKSTKDGDVEMCNPS
ncbi:hypothetical protein CAPTEDRAFT_130449 [Capitella teleta]|uniref:Protein DPCD n=1 Tax=Capitella teleta TaxID=283909 RepID=R7UF66_CAPTE|nr:hypothetical protein CAPTEDRAFT_130449 [Capitella teleta]|eukprot:ELU02413.1 hypothetical protein CAPTEDRAFT_130449 [Capitella teleta]